MKINFKLNLTIIFLIVFIASCTSKKHSLGIDDEIRVVCSKLDEPIIREYLSSVFNDTIYKSLDHKYLNEIKGLESPTTENLSKWIWSHLIKKLNILSEVRVFENDVYGCVYKGD